jgi:hypothetical protein
MPYVKVPPMGSVDVTGPDGRQGPLKPCIGPSFAGVDYKICGDMLLLNCPHSPTVPQPYRSRAYQDTSPAAGAAPHHHSVSRYAITHMTSSTARWHCWQATLQALSLSAPLFASLRVPPPHTPCGTAGSGAWRWRSLHLMCTRCALDEQL